MKVSFSTLIPQMDKEIQAQHDKMAPFIIERFYNVEDICIIKLVAERSLLAPGIPRGAQHSGHKMVKVIADIDIVPAHQEIIDLVSNYFKSQRIPGAMGAPARPLCDEVTINQVKII